MAFAETDDGVKLYFEETGEGFPVIFVHEFAGDCRSWEPRDPRSISDTILGARP